MSGAVFLSGPPLPYPGLGARYSYKGAPPPEFTFCRFFKHVMQPGVKEQYKFLPGRKPAKGAHQEVIGAILAHSSLYTKIGKSVAALSSIKTFLVFTMAAFRLAVLPRRVRLDQFAADIQSGGGLPKEGRSILL